MSQATVPFPHPLLGAVAEIGAVLDQAVESNPVYLTTEAKAEALAGLSREIVRLEGLRLKVLATAGDVAEQSGARSVGDWLAHATRVDGAAGRRAERLADALDERYTVTGTAVLAGRVNLAQAELIAAALDELPADLDPDLRARAEATLVEYAADFEPKRLRVLGRKVLEVIAPEVAEDHERQRLEREERRARQSTSLTMRRRGDGTTEVHIRLADAAAGRRKSYLEAYASPRRGHLDPTLNHVDPETGKRIPYRVLMGHAFCAMLESMPADRLPRHGGSATTVVVTIDLAALRRGLGAAELAGGDRISASEAMRLACTAKIVPLVLGGHGQPLHLGRARRLFGSRQRLAMGIRDGHCRAHGCDIPAAWCEAHHSDQPWAKGGRTDIDDGLLLCSWHHHRVHDPDYTNHSMPNGDVRFHRRR